MEFALKKHNWLHLLKANIKRKTALTFCKIGGLIVATTNSPVKTFLTINNIIIDMTLCYSKHTKETVTALTDVRKSLFVI